MRKNNAIWITMIWFVFLSISLLWNYYTAEKDTNQIVTNRARAFFNQIVVTRAWNSMHGGVYVPITEKTRPNPYLKDSLRDLTTEEGMKLTKINPAYMTRQIAEINQKEKDLHFHITSLDPIRPANKADKWETKALQMFEKGTPELLEHIRNDSVMNYRYMAPLYTEKSCLQCHAEQGYQIGEIRGGISITFPSQLYIQSKNKQFIYLFAIHLIIFVIGSLGIFKYFNMNRKFFSIIEEKNKMLESDRILLQQKNIELRKLNSEKDRFLTIIAHDLRSPFNSIIGLAELLFEKIKNKNLDQIQTFSKKIYESSRKAMDLLMNLMEWSRAQTGKLQFKPEKTNLLSFIQENVQFLQNTAYQKDIEILIQIDPDIVVLVDRRMLSTIVRNLISNAIKFSQKGGKIVITGYEHDGKIITKVKDNGIGMKKELVDDLFRIDKNTGRPGTDGEESTGLGLVLSKELTEKQGGQIWVESEEGKGSTFYVAVPV